MWHYGVGDRIQKGALLADIVDPSQQLPELARRGLYAATSGVLIARRRERLARTGDVLGKLAGAETLPDRKGLLLQD